MEAERPSETLVSYHITTWCHNPEDHDLNIRGNLKSRIHYRVHKSPPLIPVLSPIWLHKIRVVSLEEQQLIISVGHLWFHAMRTKIMKLGASWKGGRNLVTSCACCSHAYSLTELKFVVLFLRRDKFLKSALAICDFMQVSRFQAAVVLCLPWFAFCVSNLWRVGWASHGDVTVIFSVEDMSPLGAFQKI
jgi:hypothetical protein